MLSYEDWGTFSDAYEQALREELFGGMFGDPDLQPLTERELSITRTARVASLLGVLPVLKEMAFEQFIDTHGHPQERSAEYTQGVQDVIDLLFTGKPFHKGGV